MKNALILIAASAAILVGGCTSYDPPRTESISDAIDLSRLDTFTVQVNGSTATDTAFGPVRRNEALREIAQEFEGLGYEYVTHNPDFVVVFTSTIQDESQPFTTTYAKPARKVVTTEEQVVTPTGEVVTTDRSSRVVTTYESTPITLTTRQRLYVMDVVDGKTNALLWRGYMSSDDLEIRDESLEEHIEEIIESLPDA